MSMKPAARNGFPVSQIRLRNRPPAVPGSQVSCAAADRVAKGIMVLRRKTWKGRWRCWRPMRMPVPVWSDLGTSASCFQIVVQLSSCMRVTATRWWRFLIPSGRNISGRNSWRGFSPPPAMLAAGRYSIRSRRPFCRTPSTAAFTPIRGGSGRHRRTAVGLACLACLS